MSNKLFMKDAEKARDAIMDSQKKHIENLYTQWAEDIAKKGKIYEMKSAPSYALKVKQSKELEKFLKESSHVIANEVDKSIKESIYLISDSVVKSNANWLNHMGGQVKGSFLMFNSAAFSSVPDSMVRKLVTGQIYDSGWSLSKSIWGDNEDTLSKLYEIVAGGMAKNESIYDISKKLEAFVKPEAAKKWNLKTADGKRIYPKQVDYNAQRLARTLSQHAYQQSFVEVTKDNPLIIDYIWRSNGSRACPICISRDGQHYSKDSLPLDHPNGMCVMEPNIEKDYIDRVANWVKNPDGTDPEFDKFAEKIGYIAPSKKLPKTLEEFKTALGPTKYKSSGSWFNHLDPDMQKAMKEFHTKSGMSWADIHAQFYDGGKGIIGAAAKNAADVNYKFANNKIKSIFEKAGFPDPNNIPDANTFLSKIVTDSDTLVEFLKEYTSYSAKHHGIKMEDYYTKIFAKPKKVKVEFANDIQKKFLGGLGYKPGETPDYYDWLEKVKKNDDVFDDLFDTFTKVQKKDSNVSSMKDYYDYYIKHVESNNVSIKTSSSGIAYNKDEWYKKLAAQESRSNVSNMNSYCKQWGSSIPKEEKKAVIAYTGGDYWDMNEALRAGRDKGSRIDELNDLCFKGMQKASLPEDLIVRRGSDYNMLWDLGAGREFTQDDIPKFVGSIVKDKGFMSTSPMASGGFSGNIEYVINVPKGTEAVYVDSISLHKGEKEVLINADYNFKVEDIELDRGGRRVKKIFMSVIPRNK